MFCIKKIFSKISQNSQESICVGVSFLRKLQAEDQQPYWKRNSGAGVFQWLLQNFSKTAFYRIPLGDCFFMLERWAWSFIFTMVYERKRLLERILFSYTLSDFNCINCHHMLQSRPHAFTLYYIWVIVDEKYSCLKNAFSIVRWVLCNNLTL